MADLGIAGVCATRKRPTTTRPGSTADRVGAENGVTGSELQVSGAAGQLFACGVADR